MPKTSPLYNLVNSFSLEQLKAYGIEIGKKEKQKQKPLSLLFYYKNTKRNQ